MFHVNNLMRQFFTLQASFSDNYSYLCKDYLLGAIKTRTIITAAVLVCMIIVQRPTNTTEANSHLSGWFTLDGRKLSGNPNANGIYIYNGRKKVISSTFAN